MNESELQKRYDELDAISTRLDLLIDTIKIYVDTKENLEIIKADVEKEKDEIEPRLIEARDREETERENGYWTTQF